MEAKMSGQYILDDENNPVPCEDLLEWAMWFEKDKRIIARTEIAGGLVSTVFLGIDHRFNEKGPPILWESMVFSGGPSDDEEQYRYTSHADALRGHEEIVQRLKANGK
jgi:hypothetical protein